MKITRSPLCFAPALAALFVGLGAAFPVRAEIIKARELLRDNQPAQAGEALQKALAAKPGDPWLIYDTGIAAYAAKDFAKANDIWEQLAGTDLPDALREHVWTQIGNVSYRLVQDTISKEPDAALSGLEQSREAFRVALSQNKRNEVAAQNLVVVERELERIYALLARRLVEEAKKERDLQKSIDKFQAALEHQQNANALAPKDAEHEKAKQEIEQQLAQKFTEKAEKTEQQADKADTNNEWQRKQAQEQLENALADFRQAQTYEAQKEPAKQGEKRVQEKLANLLTKDGQHEQREAENKENNNDPEHALDHFDTAMQDYQQAQAQNPEQAEAKKGEEEVRAEMEKIHLAEGDRAQKAGEEQAQRQPEQAAGKMLGALEHFEEARDLDPQNKAIQDRIDKVQAELPAMLMAMGKQEQRDAAKEEGKSPGAAVAHLERAETALDKAERLAPENQEAQQMQQQVQSDLARLRQQLAAEAQKQQEHPPAPHPGQEQTLEAMMAQMKATQDQREVNMRHSPPKKYDPAATSPFRNW